jgi:hypothetical protein
MSLQACTITDRSINLLLDGRMRTLPQSHPNFARVRELIRTIGLATPWDPEELDGLRQLVDIPTFLAKITEGLVEVNGSEVRYAGKPLHGHIVKRMLDLLAQGDDIRPIARFLDRAKKNPFHETAIDEMFNWLEHSKMPLTSDGCFIAYKFVNADYRDAHSNKIDNRIGAAIPRLDPATVDSRRENTCAASGYHFCSWGYTDLTRYPHTMLVKVAPEDVCSFPYSEVAKGRCMFYEVIAEVPADELQARAIETEGVVDSLGTYDESDDESGSGLFDDGIDHDDSYEYAEPEADDAPDLSPGSGEPGACGDDAPTIDDGLIAVVAIEVEDDDQPEPDTFLGEREDGVAPVVEKRTKITFKKRDGTKIGQNKLLKAVSKWGQREAARRLGVPRSTLQDWIKVATTQE